MDDMRAVLGFLGLVAMAAAGCIASTDTTDVSREPPCASDVALAEGGGLRLCDEVTVHRSRDSQDCTAGRGCARDGDCAGGELCDCITDEGACVPAECFADADCLGGLCVRSQDACGTHGFFCETEADLCQPGRDGCVFWEQRGRWEPGGAVGCE